MKRIITIGGGGGHSQVLKGLKDIPDIAITAICPTTDSGGSTGILQKEYGGKGYIGDITKCIAALTSVPSLSKALSYRYEGGPLNGHSVKNLLFLALEKTSNLKNALKIMREVCGLGKHRVFPVTNEKTELCAHLIKGNRIIGETNIDKIAKNPLWNPNTHAISDVYLSPKVKASKEFIKAIEDSEYMIICPGDLYSSVLPTLLPKLIKQTIKKSKTKIILILNIMTKRGETDNYTASDFVKIIEKYLGRKADYIICNKSSIPKGIILRYSLENKVKMGKLSRSDKRVIFAPLAEITKGGQISSNPEVINKVMRKILSDKT